MDLEAMVDSADSALIRKTAILLVFRVLNAANPVSHHPTLIGKLCLLLLVGKPKTVLHAF